VDLFVGLELVLSLGLVMGLAYDFPMWFEWNWMSGTRRVATASEKITPLHFWYLKNWQMHHQCKGLLMPYL